MNAGTSRSLDFLDQRCKRQGMAGSEHGVVGKKRSWEVMLRGVDFTL